ncbi:NUDIX domain-containing protein [Ramlibacter albus]|nr:NUDIX domain-containing protein [Ramlibacter albus]
MFRRRDGALEVLLAHPGGPFWARKDDGAWALPKGEYDDQEEALAAAQREFTEETGFTAQGPFISLGEVRQRSGKRVKAWAFEGDCDPAQLRSNEFEMEWPPHSGRMKSFPEIDKLAWYGAREARLKLLPSQLPFLERLEQGLAAGSGG